MPPNFDRVNLDEDQLSIRGRTVVCEFIPQECHVEIHYHFVGVVFAILNEETVVGVNPNKC